MDVLHEGSGVRVSPFTPINQVGIKKTAFTWPFDQCDMI